MPTLAPVCTHSDRRVRRPGQNYLEGRHAAVLQTVPNCLQLRGSEKMGLIMIFAIAIGVPIHLLMVSLLTLFPRSALESVCFFID